MATKTTKSTKSIKSITSTTSKKTEVKATATIAKARDTRGTSITRGTHLKIDVIDLKGKVIESMNLPEVLFGVKVNKQLLAQAVRVYLANQRAGSASTKTRGEVQGSTRKIYRQKGTGRARHGGVRAPIFVKGGIAHGPKPQDYSLKLSQAMRQKALIAALTAKFEAGDIKVVTGFATVKPKTKNIAQALSLMALDAKKRSILLVTSSDLVNVSKAVRNLEGVSFDAAVRLHPYEVLQHRTVILMKEAIEVLEKRVSTA